MLLSAMRLDVSCKKSRFTSASNAIGGKVPRLQSVQVSDHFQAVLGCLLREDWTTPRLAEMVITPDGHLLGRCEGEASFRAFLGASEDLLRNIHGVALVADLDGDEIGYLVGKVAEIKKQR